jgi:1-acyl-sn-glycerol-3-phosphate acyltransferase
MVLVFVSVVVGAPLLLRNGPASSKVGRRAARLLLWALGVRHDVRGHVPQRATLVVANHVSWLDVLVITAYLPVRLVARHDVRDWPVVGWLARLAGTLFIDRSRLRALPHTVKQVEAVLRAGSVVATFPEGTTWCGNQGGRFRPALFQSAINAGVPVAPVTLAFSLASGDTTTVAAFVGHDSLLASVWRVVAAHGVRVSVRMHPALYPEPGSSRRALARATQAAITAARAGTVEQPARRARHGTFALVPGSGRAPADPRRRDEADEAWTLS